MNQEKIQQLIQANILLGIENMETKFKHNNIIFIYSVPKVGSTSLASTLLVFASAYYVVFHIHDEVMLKTLYGIDGVTIKEIIEYNNTLNRNIFVIDIYRNPIEHKISTFFEKIDAYHFNTTAEQINSTDTSKLILRFNQIFQHIANGDIFMDVFNIDKNTAFNNDLTNEKYLYFIKGNIKYLKLRLCDVAEWKFVIKKILHINCVIMNDYSSNSKIIKEAYSKFNNLYKIPENFLDEIKNNKYFNFYNTDKEQQDYLNKWNCKTDTPFISYTNNEYQLYTEISNLNQRNNYIDNKHYIYDGCICKGCQMKKNELVKTLLDGKPAFKIIHEEANMQLAMKKVERVRAFIANYKPSFSNRTKTSMSHVSGLNFKR